MQKKACIVGVGTAVPEYSVTQREIQQFTATLFARQFAQFERLAGVFANAAIETRYLAQPLTWYAERHSFAEANKVFCRTALELATKAAYRAMQDAAVNASEIGAVIFISSTGIATPTLDATLIQRLHIPDDAIRLPVWGLGCGGGVAGLARASEMAVHIKERLVLLVCVELCSLTFQREDYSKANVIGSSLFGDGAAAVLVGCREGKAAICGRYSRLFAATQDIMGWDLIDSGLKVRFSKSIPEFVRQHLPDTVHRACRAWGIEQSQIQHYVVHPGGAKVLKAYEDSLGLAAGRLAVAQAVLHDYGNLSSAAVLFVLEKWLKTNVQPAEYALLVALGPGFSAEQVLLQC